MGKAMQRKGVTYNSQGVPFSKWKPAEKFSWVFATEHNAMWYVCESELPFDDERGWRLDFAWPDQLLGVEIDGFGYGHQAQQRISDNNEKRNAAVEQGWRLLVFDSRLLGSRAKVSEAVEQVCRVLCSAVSEED